MNNALEFDKILNLLCEQASSEHAQKKIMELEPYLSEIDVKSNMKETTEAKIIIERIGTFPLASMKEIDKVMVLLSKDAMLLPEQLENVAQFLTTCRRIKDYLKRAESMDLDVAYYGVSIYELRALYDEIENSIRNGMVDDRASTLLRDIRRKKENLNSQIKSKMDSMLRNNKAWFSDGYVVTRNGRMTLPVKKEYKNQVAGAVIEMSQTGGTYFIEPSAVSKLKDEIYILQLEEENEIMRILYMLTKLVDESAMQININIEAIETLDFIFAKAKLSITMGASPVTVTTGRKLKIISGRHPLLNKETAVPLDIELGSDNNGVVITGPNTGGKTVALKTVGLLSMMAQSGLHVPVSNGSVLCMRTNYLCDIGDGQSITENLSTFSSHMTNIIEMLKIVDADSLVLLDELGSGTDPLEGMGLAIAILIELKNIGCLFVATTHYPEVKEFTKNTDKLINARMEFDKESLRPMYKLVMGEAGESCALYIARRLGLPNRMLKAAYDTAYGAKTTQKQQQYTQTDFLYEETPKEAKPPTKQIKKEEVKTAKEQPKGSKFNIGDSVIIYPQKLIGIVFQKSNDKGEVGVQIKGRKQLISYKRIKLKVSASEMYPEDYDFSIVFDSVSTRKAHHSMERKHDPNIIIKHEPINLKED